MRSLFQITSRTGLIACLSIGLLGIFSPPKAFAEVGIDLKLGGGKPPELDIHGENHGLFENVGPQTKDPRLIQPAIMTVASFIPIARLELATATTKTTAWAPDGIAKMES